MSEGADSFTLQNAEQPNGMIFTTRKGTTDAQNIARRPKLGRRVLNRIRCDAAARNSVFEQVLVVLKDAPNKCTQLRGRYLDEVQGKGILFKGRVLNRT